MLAVYLICTAVFAAAFLVALKQKLYRSNGPMFAVVCVVFAGFFVGSVLLLSGQSEHYALFIGALACGLAVCTVAALNIRAAFVCEVPIEGIYRGFVEYPAVKGPNALAPVFEYDYEGEHYRVQSPQSYPEKRLLYEMTPGDTYPIYIEAAHPSHVVLDKRVPWGNVALLVAGVACMVVGVLTLFA